MAPVTPVQSGRLQLVPKAGTPDGPLVLPRFFPISSGYGTAVAPGQLVYTTSGNIQLVAAGTAVLGVVSNVFKTAGGVPFKEGYRPASVAGYCEVIPITSYNISICEDGAGGLINFPTNSYVDILAQSILNTTSNNYDPAIVPFAQLDSSTAASSAGSLTFQILRIDEGLDNIRIPGDTTTPRRFIVAPVSSLTQTGN
jgi:hypothetical protein